MSMIAAKSQLTPALTAAHFPFSYEQTLSSPYKIRVFSSPELDRGAIGFSVTRRNNRSAGAPTYHLCFARGYGTGASQVCTSLGPIVSPSQPDGESRARIWMKPDIEQSGLRTPGRTLAGLLVADSDIVRPTGRLREEDGAPEVEILLSEGQLAHSCYCCGLIECGTSDEERMKRILGNGKGSDSLYACKQCDKKLDVGRAVFKPVFKYWRLWWGNPRT